MKREAVHRWRFGKALLAMATAVTAVAAAAVLAGGFPAAGQAASPQGAETAGKDAFEIVSIRRSVDQNLPPGGRSGGGGENAGCIGLPQIDPGRIVFNDQSLYTLIAHAYGLVCSDVGATGRISGGPKWTRSDKWVVQALSPQGTQFDTSVMVAPFRSIADLRLRRMLQNLLADRFKLVIHRETKEMPVYALSVAKGDSKLQHPGNVPCTARGGKPFVPLSPRPRAVLLARIESDPIRLCRSHTIGVRPASRR